MSVFFLGEDTEPSVRSSFLEWQKISISSSLGSILLSCWPPRKGAYFWHTSTDVTYDWGNSDVNALCSKLCHPPLSHSCVCPANHQVQSDLLQKWFSGSGLSLVPTATTIIQLLVICSDWALLAEFCSCPYSTQNSLGAPHGQQDTRPLSDIQKSP